MGVCPQAMVITWRAKSFPAHVLAMQIAIEPRIISLYKRAGFYLEDLIGWKVAASRAADVS